MRYLYLIVICITVFCRSTLAETTNHSITPPAPVVSTSAPAGSAVTISDESVPVPVPEPDARAVRLYHTGNIWWCARTIWGLALPALLLFTGFSARMRNAARRIGKRWYFIIGAYFVMLALLSYGLTWPLDYFQGFVRPHAYGLSEQTFKKWFGDSLIQLVITLVAGVLFLWVPYWLVKKSPRRWWLYTSLAAIAFFFFVQLIRPVAIDPLFNHFTPVENKTLETKILALAERAGIHGSRVYEVKKSVDTKTVNAYVTGFGSTKRIVLWDNAINKLDEHELLFVMGHEMGHYALGHVVKGILFLSLLTFIAFYGVHRVAAFLITRGSGRFGFNDLSDIASLPLVVLLLQLFSLVLTPVGFAYSRHLEHEADRFGLELTHYNHSAATGFTRLQKDDLAMPRPGLFYNICRATHPSVGDRIDFYNSYHPWQLGEPSRYARLFQSPNAASGTP